MTKEETFIQGDAEADISTAMQFCMDHLAFQHIGSGDDAWQVFGHAAIRVCAYHHAQSLGLDVDDASEVARAASDATAAKLKHILTT